MSSFLNSCGGLKGLGPDVKDIPINDADKRKKNIEEGRGITLGNAGRNKGGSFNFATSNEMWRACLLYTSPSPRDRQKSRMPSSA